MYDLKNLDIVAGANDGARLDLRHPGTDEVLRYGDDDEKTMHLVLLGRDSDGYKKKLRQQQRKMLKKAQQSRKFSASTMDEADRESMDLLVCAVAGGMIFENGQEVAVTQDNAESFFTDHPWMKEQADAFIHDRANFLPNS